MSLDALENWINSKCQENASLAPTAITQQEMPDNPDPLALFSEDGISLVDNNWLKHYWDPYELDSGLKNHITPAVDLSACVQVPPLESSEADMGPLPDHLLEEVGALPHAACFTLTAGFIPQDPTAAFGKIINGLPDV